MIPSKSDQPRQPGFDKAAYRQRNQVERSINRLKGWRRVATRYEKREVNYLAMVTIAAIVLLWLGERVDAPWLRRSRVGRRGRCRRVCGRAHRPAR